MEREKNIFDKIGSLIPGYRGYAEREGRRQCDKLLREGIVSIMEQCEKIISNQIDESIKDTGRIKTLETYRKRINTLASKIKFSPYGASAFFSNSQIKEAELKQIYEKDLAILEKVVLLKTTTKNKEPKDISLEITSIEEILEDRNQFIKEFK